MLLDRARMERILDLVFDTSVADQTEVIVSTKDAYLTRFANNTIHQSVGGLDHSVILRTVLGKRSFVNSTNRLDDAMLREFVERTVRLTALQPEVLDFPGLPRTEQRFDAEAWDTDTAYCAPNRRARLVTEAIDIARSNDLDAAGFLTTEAESYAVANSLGNRGFYRHTNADFSMTGAAPGMGRTGWTLVSSRSINSLDVPARAASAVQKGLLNRDQRAMEPGRYTVILEPPAVADLLLYLIWLGFGGQRFAEKRSVFSDRIGEQVMPPHISLSENPHHSRIQDAPFDFEGMPKQPIPLIERGVVRGIALDSLTAAQTGRPNNGHSQPAGMDAGPFPFNIVLDEGEFSRDELIASTKRGILVTRLWYNRVVDVKRCIITGMTRDGTFLIENGEVTGAVKNMRYNMSVVDVLKHTDALTRERTMIRDDALRYVVPTLRSNDFNFTATTSF